MNQKLAGAFYRWSEFVEEAVRMRTLMSRIAQRMANREIFMVLNPWREMVNEQRVRMRRLQKVMGMWKNRLMAMGFNAWVSFYTTLRRQRYVLAKAHKRW